MCPRIPWLAALFLCAGCANAAEGADVEILVGSARWQADGEARCGWLPAGARPLELLLDQDAQSPSASLLVFDRQHVFELQPDGPGTYVAISIESTVSSGVPSGLGHLRLPAATTDGSVDLDFKRRGDDCKLRLSLAPDLQLLSDAAEITAAQRRLRGVAAVARRMSESVHLLRVKNDAKGALVVGREAYDSARVTLGENEPLTASAAENLGSVYWNLGEFAAAREMAEVASSIFEKNYGFDAALTVDARTNLSLYLWELEDLAGARAGFERDRPLVIARYGERSNAALVVSSNLALLYQELGLLQEALDLTSFVYLAREARDGPNDRATLITLNNLASALNAMGRSDDSLQLRLIAYDRYKSALGERDPDTLRAKHNLGSELCVQSLPDCRMLAETAQTRAEVLGRDHPEALHSRSQFGWSLLQQGRAAEALPELEGVYQARLNKMSGRHWLTTLSLTLMGQARALSADPELGLQQMRSAITSFEQLLGPAHTRTLEAMSNLALVCERLKRPACTRETLETFVERAEGERGLVLLRGAQQSTSIQRWVPSYRTLALLQANQGDVTTAVRTIERSKARRLLATLGVKSAERSGVPPDAAERIAAFERELAALEDQRSGTVDPERLVQLEVRQSAIARELAALRADLRARFPKYAAATQVNVPDPAILARSLGSDEIFIGYATVRDGFLVYIADAQARFHVQHLPFLHAHAAIEAWREVTGAVEPAVLWRLADGSFRASAARPSADAQRALPAELAEHLRKMLLDPVSDRLVRYKRWVISPDGALATLPFETLPWQSKRIADSVEVRYAQSLAVYWLLRQRAAVKQGALFAMGGPTFAQRTADETNAPRYLSQLDDKLSLRGRTQVSTMLARSADDPQSTRRAFVMLGINWPPLPEAEREARAVAALFPGAAVFTGNEASEERLQQMDARGELARFRYLLFSTHGYLSTEAPALSSVVLRQPGSPQADGYVTAAEWVGYSLRSDLIVLSACETGLGKEVAGEGVMGLPYALFVAGNRNTLLSLWKVPDASTAEFMIRFFRKLRAGAPQVTALAETKRELMKSARFHDPIHWAGFVLYGS